MLGVVSRTDLLSIKRLAISDPDRVWEKVEDVMMPLVFALYETAAVSQAAGLMAVEGVHRLLVASPRGELVGILSALDVMRWLADRDGYLRSSATSEEKHGARATEKIHEAV